MKGAILILSGPSGAGKSTIIEKAKPYIGDFYFSISTTTREPREGEVDGVDYHFVDNGRFEEGIRAGEFLEYAKVHNNYYGTSLKPVQDAIEGGKLVIFDIDVQGHKLARQRLNHLITSAFITPPSLQELERRLVSRATDNQEIIQNRLNNAKSEISYIKEYDYLIVNDDVEVATEEFISIARASRLKSSLENLDSFVDAWLGK